METSGTLRAPKSYGAGRGTTRGFAVEVRTTYPQPDTHPLGFIIDGVWRRVPARVVKCQRQDHINQPSGNIGEIPVWNYSHELDHLDLANFEAAYTLACLIQAQQWNGGCVECRLIEVEVVYSYEAKEHSVGEPISLSGLRRSYALTPTVDGTKP